MKTLHVTKSRHELVILLETGFPSEYDLKQYWCNIANIVTRNESKLTVEKLFHWLRYLTVLEAFPEVVTSIPCWLPQNIQVFLAQWRIRHLDRYIHPDEECISKFYHLSSQFPLIISLLTDDKEFIRLFVQCQDAKR